MTGFGRWLLPALLLVPGSVWGASLLTYSDALAIDEGAVNATLSLPGFSPGRGTLLQVQVALIVDNRGTVTLSNPFPLAQSYGGYVATVLNLVGPGGLALGVTAEDASIAGTLDPFATQVRPAAPGNTSGLDLLSGDPYFDAFVTTGTLVFTATGGSGTSIPAVDVTNLDLSGTATLSVRYRFDPSTSTVPEPATWVLIGTALAGAVARRTGSRRC